MTVVVFVVVMFFVNMTAGLTLSGAGENESMYIFSFIYLEEHTWTQKNRVIGCYRYNKCSIAVNRHLYIVSNITLFL